MPRDTYQQHSPFSVQIELVEGCTFACSFCGINGIRKRAGLYKFAALPMLRHVAEEIARLKWTPRIEFAVHGEPSMHPHVIECVETFRKALPKLSLMMTSNGTGFQMANIHRIPHLFRAGLNVLALDNYDGHNVVNQIVADLKERHKDIKLRFYPDDKKASVHRKRRPSEHEVVVLADLLSANQGNHSFLSNHAGCAFPPDYSKENQRCAFPFRELTVRWDGNVSLCCDDFRGIYKVGNVMKMPLDKLWLHERFDAARRKLYHRQRDFPPCKGCNAVSYRVGLLPNPTGQETLPEPTAADEKILRNAVAGNPYTTPIPRPWES